MNLPLYQYLFAGLTAPRPISPQTEHQLAEDPRYQVLDLKELFADPDRYLEDYENETLLGPNIPASLSDRANVSPILHRTPLNDGDLHEVAQALVQSEVHKPIHLQDGTEVPLRITEPLISRYMKLLRLDVKLKPGVAEQLYEGLNEDLAGAAHALARERSLSFSLRQRAFADIAVHAARRRELAVADLETLESFVAQQNDLDPEAVRAALADAIDSAFDAYEKARGGRAYISQAVAEHHDSHGAGEIDEELLAARRGHWQRLMALQEDLKTWDGLG